MRKYCGGKVIVEGGPTEKDGTRSGYLHHVLDGGCIIVNRQEFVPHYIL